MFLIIEGRDSSEGSMLRRGAGNTRVLASSALLFML